MRIKSIKVKKSPNQDHLLLIIKTTDKQLFQFEIHQGLAWRVRHMIHKKLGFDEGELALGQRIGRWQG